MSAEDKLFYQGFAVAVGTLARSGYPSQAKDIMDTNGVTLEMLRKAGADQFDLKPLKSEFGNEHRRGRRRGSSIGANVC